MYLQTRDVYEYEISVLNTDIIVFLIYITYLYFYKPDSE